MIVCLFLFAAVIFDLKFYRIPNVLCLSMALTGIFFSFLSHGWQGVMESLVGMCVPLVLLYLLFYCGMLGAGDVKLFAAMGTFLGARIVYAIALSFLFNGIAAAILLYRKMRFQVRWNYFKGYVRDCLLSGHLLRDYQAEAEDKIHFSIGIFLTSLLWMFACWIQGRSGWL